MNEEYLKHISLEISEDMKKFVKNDVFGNSEYLFFPGKGKEEKAYCSKCKKIFSSKGMELKHNQKGICPKCLSNVTAKNSNYGKKNLRNEACFYYFEKSIFDPNTIICKGYYVYKCYSKSYKNPKEDYLLQAVYVFDGKEASMWKNSWVAGIEKRSSVFEFNINWLGTKDCHYSNNSMKKAIKGTRYQYIPEELISRYGAIKIFTELTKYPWIEQMWKLGLERLVCEKIEKREMHRCLNYKGKDIYGILRLSKGNLREIRKSEVTISPLFLKIYQMQLKQKSNLTPEEVKEIEHSCMGSIYKLEKIIKFMTIKKLSKYLNKQKEIRGLDLIVYDDYLKNCLELGLDIRLESVLFPKNIYEIHENIIKQIKISNDAEFNLKISERLKDIKEKYVFEYKGLIIRVAESTEELIEEGSKLNHCVATNYTKLYANGEIMILFIRRAEEEEKPFFTVEVRKGEIKQVRGIKNTDATEEVAEFIEVYKKEKLNKKIKKVA